MLYNGYFGSEYPAIKSRLDRVSIRTLLQASLMLTLCYMKKAIFALCPIIPKNKKKIDSLFCLKILDTICWGRNVWQSSNTVCEEGKDQKDVFNAELYNSNRRSSVNSFSYEWSFSKELAVYLCPFVLRQEPFLRFPEISQIFHVNVFVESGFVSCTATYSY